MATKVDDMDRGYVGNILVSRKLPGGYTGEQEIGTDVESSKPSCDTPEME